jgi:hypothetical protein
MMYTWIPIGAPLHVLLEIEGPIELAITMMLCTFCGCTEVLFHCIYACICGERTRHERHILRGNQ